MEQIVIVSTELPAGAMRASRQTSSGDILEQLYALSDQACTVAERKVLRSHGLDMRSWLVLKAIGQSETATQRQIAKITGLDKVAVNRATSWIKAHGLVNTFPNMTDGRSHLLELSFAGKQTLAECTRKLAALEAGLLSGLSDHQNAELTHILNHLSSSLSDPS